MNSGHPSVEREGNSSTTMLYIIQDQMTLTFTVIWLLLMYQTAVLSRINMKVLDFKKLILLTKWAKGSLCTTCYRMFLPDWVHFINSTSSVFSWQGVVRKGLLTKEDFSLCLCNLTEALQIMDDKTWDDAGMLFEMD